MSDLVELGFSIDSKPVKTAGDDLSKMATASDKASKAHKKQETNAGSLTKKLGGLAKAVGVVGLGAFAADALSTFAKFEQMEASVKTLTGSSEAAAEAMAKIEKFAKSTPFTLEQSVEGFKKLKSLGLDPSMEALNSYGNTASAMGKSMTQMVEAVADATTGEFERLKEFGIKADARGEDVKFTFQGITTSVGKNAAEIEGYLQSIGNVEFAGAMADQMETFNGKLSNLKDGWEKFKVALFKDTGAGALATSLVGVLGDMVQELPEKVEELSNKFAEFKKKLGTSQDPAYVAIRGVGETLGKFLDFLSPITPYLADFAKYIGIAAAAAGGISLLGTGMTLVAGGVKAIGLALVANPIGATITVIAAAGALIYKNWDGISAWFGGIMNSMGLSTEKLKKKWDAAFEVIMDPSKWFPTAISIATGAAKMHAALLKAGKDALFSFADGLLDKWDDVFAPIMNTFEWFPSAADIRAGAKSMQDSLVTAGRDAIKGFADGLLDFDLKQIVEKVVDNIPTWAKKLLDIRSPSRVMHKLGRFVTEGMANGMEDAVPMLSDAVKNMITTVEKGVEGLGDSLEKSILSGDSFKETLGNMGDYAKNWLKEQAAHFARNKIMASFGLEGDGNIFDKLKGALGGAGNGSIFSGLFGAGRSAGGAVGSLDAAAGYGQQIAGIFSSNGKFGSMLGGKIGMIGDKIGGLGKMLGNKLSSLGGMGLGGALMVRQLGTMIGDKLGAANSKMVGNLAGLGAAIAGPLGAGIGAVVGSAFGSGWKDVAQGFEVSFGPDGVAGQNFVRAEKERSLWRGTKVSERFSELDTQVQAQLTGYFDNLNMSVTESARVLGVAGADSIMDSFSVATQRFSGENAEAELQEWLSESTRSAYQLAFDELNPQIQAVIGGSVDMLEGSVEDIQAIFTRFSTATTVVSDATTLLNLNFDKTAATAPLAADALVQLMGGIEGFTAQTNAYYETYYSAEERQQLALATSAAAVEAFNVRMQASGQQTIATTAEFRKYVEGLNLQTEEGRTAYAQAMNIAGSFAEVAESGQSADQILAGMPETMTGAVQQMRADADEGFNAIAEKSRQLTEANQQAAQSYQDAAFAIQLAAHHASVAAQVARNEAIASARAARESNARATSRVHGFDNDSGGNYAGGIGYVPEDGHRATLHRGEAVLTREQNASLRNLPNLAQNGARESARASAVMAQMLETSAESSRMAQVQAAMTQRLVMVEERSSEILEQVLKTSERTQRKAATAS